jgi:beta-lactamase class D
MPTPFSVRPLTPLAVLSLSLLAVPSRPDDVRDLGKYFESYGSTLVVLDVRTGRATRHHPELARARFSPCSTFKIPNSLIGLETGVVPAPDFVLPWDGQKRDRDSWNRDHDLRSALANSVVWYYQELARRVGPTRMAEFVSRLHYGNEDLSGGVDRFWLGSTLRISPDEQAAFLRRFEAEELPVSPRSVLIVKELLEQPWAEGVVYRGKTGSCRDGEKAPQHGWWVGSVTRGEGTFAFAGLIRGAGASGMAARPLVERALQELRVLPTRP